MFEKGDKVLINPKFDKYMFHESCQFLVGKIVTIDYKSYTHDNYYYIKEENHCWNEKYLIPLKIIKTKPKITNIKF